MPSITVNLSNEELLEAIDDGDLIVEEARHILSAEDDLHCIGKHQRSMLVDILTNEAERKRSDGDISGSTDIEEIIELVRV